MTPEETSLFAQTLNTFNQKFDKHVEELRKNTTATELISESVKHLQHDLLGNGQPGRIQEIEANIKSHSKYIYTAMGGLTVLGAIMGWMITIVKTFLKAH